MCADIRINICFLFTLDSSKGFLLRHNDDDLLTVNDREKAVVGVEGGELEVNNLEYTKRRKHNYAIRKHETTNGINYCKFLTTIVNISQSNLSFSNNGYCSDNVVCYCKLNNN